MSSWNQLDLIGFIGEQPKPATTVTQPPPYSIKRSPTTGYKVVLAPGLTSEPLRNPCGSCPNIGQDKDDCSVNCLQSGARSLYLSSIGAPILSGVTAEGGAYGVAT